MAMRHKVEHVLTMGPVEAANLVPKGKQTRFTDGKIKALKLRVYHGNETTIKGLPLCTFTWQVYCNGKYETAAMNNISCGLDDLPQARQRALMIEERMSRGPPLDDDPVVDPATVVTTGVYPSFAQFHAVWRREHISARSSDPQIYAERKEKAEHDAKVRLERWMKDIAEKPLDKISGVDIVGCHKAALAKGKKTTANKVLTEAVSVMQFAEAFYHKDGFRAPPLPRVKRPPKGSRKDAIGIDPRHWADVWAKGTPITRWLMLCGHRPSMAFRIKWEHIDMADRKCTLPENKKGQSNIDFPLCDEQIEILKLQAYLQEREEIETEYVFHVSKARCGDAFGRNTSSPGDPMRIHHVDADCHQIARKAKIAACTPYSFRVSLATFIDNTLPEIPYPVACRLADQTPGQDARSRNYAREPKWKELVEGHKRITSAVLSKAKHLPKLVVSNQ